MITSAHFNQWNVLHNSTVARRYCIAQLYLLHLESITRSYCAMNALKIILLFQFRNGLLIDRYIDIVQPMLIETKVIS